MKIRVYEEKDKHAVIELWHSCGLVAPQNDPARDIDLKLQVNPDLFLVGERSGEIVASVMGGYEGHRGWINYLAVKPAAQRNGYGRQIMRHVESLLHAKGCPKINLQVRESKASVIAFYESLGYLNDHVISLGKRLSDS